MTLPLLLTALQAARVCGVSRSTFNAWVAQGRVPAEVVAEREFGGWPRYRSLKLQQWANGDLEDPQV